MCLFEQENGDIKSSHYHAGMKPKERIYIQNKWRQGELQVYICAKIVRGPQLIHMGDILGTFLPACTSEWPPVVLDIISQK